MLDFADNQQLLDRVRLVDSSDAFEVEFARYQSAGTTSDFTGLAPVNMFGPPLDRSTHNYIFVGQD